MVRRGSGVQIPETAPYFAQYIMITPENPSAAATNYLAGFRQAEYWGGHTLGDGDAIRPVEPVVDTHSKRTALDALNTYVRSGGARIPPFMLDEPYRYGDTFDANDFPPGSIFWMDCEMYGRPLSARPDAAPAADNPAILDRLGAIGTTQTIAWPDGATYESYASWGVTARTKKGQILLHEVTVPRVSLTSEGTLVRESTRIEAWPAQHTIGKVEHEVGPGLEVMGRMLRMYRCAAGRPRPTRRRTVFGVSPGAALAGRLRPAHITS